MSKLEKNTSTHNMSLFIEALLFEHWARYHCMSEKLSDTNDTHNTDILSENPCINIPVILREKCKKEVPHLTPLLEQLHTSKISLDSARNHLMTFFQNYLCEQNKNLNPIELQDIFIKEVERISASEKFARYLDIFYTFVQEQADIEDNKFIKTEELVAKEVASTMLTSTQKEKDECIALAMQQYIDDIEIPSFTTWIENFHTWAKEKKFRLEVE